MRTLNDVIELVSRGQLSGVSDDALHYLMMYRYLLRDQAAADENMRKAKTGGIMSKVIQGLPEKKK
ncbi:MAG: hypothetical protein IJI57_07330 [Flexilinea sp.]|nr:hypothetical protein [Flexilinea sp.]